MATRGRQVETTIVVKGGDGGGTKDQARRGVAEGTTKTLRRGRGVVNGWE